MEFYVALVILGTLLIVTQFVIRVVKIGTRHTENIHRIKRGYPTLEGDTPVMDREPDKKDSSDRLQ